MPNADHNKSHGHNGTILAKDVNEDLKDRLVIWRTDCVFEVLDAEEETDNVEETKNCRYD